MSIADEITNNTKKIINMKMIYAAIIIIVWILWYFVYSFSFIETTEKAIEENPYVVKKWDIRISLASEWDIVWDDIIDLNFQVSDVISNIYIKPWDKVKKWDLLAKLDSLLLQINVDKAKIALETAKIQWRIDVDNAKITLDNTKNNLDFLKKELKSQSGSNYSLIQDQEKQILESDKNNIMTQIWQTLTIIESTLYETDLLFWISTSNAHKNDGFEIYLSAKNSSLKNTTEMQWRLINKAYIEFQNKWELFREWTNVDSIEQYLSTNIQLTKDAILLTENVLNSLKASVSSVDFTETTIVNYTSKFEANETSLKKYITDLYKVQQKVSLTQASSNTKIWTMINDLNSKILLAENEYKKAEMLYNTVISRSNDLPIQLAEKNLLEAQKRLSYSRLKAPTDWVILSLNGHEWEIVWWNNSIPFVQLAIDNDMYIEAYVESVDVLKVFSEQEVMISLDNIEGLNFTWVVFFVANVGEEDSNNIMEYKVLISFNHKDERIKNGMSVSINYITKEVKNVVVVPVKAVKSYNNTPHVKMKNNEYIEIVPWFTDGKMIEIMTWLNEWDVILVEQ